MIVGGAVSGSEAARLLAERGAQVVVIEQGARPYGKIEDGLPRWHEKLRAKEYVKIGENLDRPEIHFVPQTVVGDDVTMEALLEEHGARAVILASGAWRDRRLPIDGADEYIDKGLVYQNAFIQWFNHAHEEGYDGPRYETPEGAIVVGGGLASVDVVKVLQLMNYQRAFAKRDVEVSLLELELKGIDGTGKKHEIDPASLGVEDCTLFYRRRMEDMPLASAPAPTEEQRKKLEKARVKIMSRLMRKYRVRFQAQRSPLELITEEGRVAGMVFAETRLVDGRVRAVEGSRIEVRAPLVISSIGSVPERIPGIPSRGELYDFNWDTGEVKGAPQVFGLGNVLTGKGNIKDSRKNAIEIATALAEGVLGLGDVDEAVEAMHEEVARKVAPVVDAALQNKASSGSVIEWAKARQREIGYDGYASWLQSHRPE